MLYINKNDYENRGLDNRGNDGIQTDYDILYRFSIADKFGVEAIKDTYKRVFQEWKYDYKYITELAMVLNWKLWRWYGKNDELSMLYDSLWKEIDGWCIDNLKGKELEYYYKTTD